MSVQLPYGQSGRFTCEIAAPRLVAWHRAPPNLTNLKETTLEALQNPLDFPPLEQLCIPGDQIVLALDRATPGAAELLAAVWTVLEQRGVDPESLQILQPAQLGAPRPADPRAALPEAVRGEIRWSIHDPTNREQQAYLAASARGERIYLARALVEADVVISIGNLAYDPVLGYRGTSSVLYPGLSDSDAVARTRGEGHSELGLGDERPLRQTIDEIAWLLGTQFSIQTIAAAGDRAAEVLAGATESVYRTGKRRLDELWSQSLPQRAEVVVVAIDADAAGHGWEQLGAALSTARNLVARGGKIVVLSELEAEPGDGIKLIRESRSPRNALQPIRKQAPVDMIPAAQLATATDWARVYLLSRLPSDLVDELFMVPLENEREAARLLGSVDQCVLLEGAQHTHAEVQADGVAE